MFSTATKIRLARAMASTLLCLGFRAERRIRRGDVVYEVDLREGIDLSLFLFGAFQRHVLQTVRQLVPVDGVVIDVGANIGAVALPAAAHLAHGHVYAFEPTDFAWSKLERNVELNPQLRDRVTLVKSFVADTEASESRMIAYSSWPVVHPADAELHPVHKGAAKPAACGQTTLDQFVEERGLTRLSLIKIDTDGHEFSVLSGAMETLRRFCPVVLFEACDYLMKPPRPAFADFEALFHSAGYTIRAGAHEMNAAEFYARCPRGGGLDLVAMPGG
jgi:FkbM family methyltransferase